MRRNHIDVQRTMGGAYEFALARISVIHRTVFTFSDTSRDITAYRIPGHGRPPRARVELTARPLLAVR
jgi:hypothetical protein